MRRRACEPQRSARFSVGIDLRTRLADEVKTLLQNEGLPVIGTRR
jgi:hypothetical protein